jgi:hypothetical protein
MAHHHVNRTNRSNTWQPSARGATWRCSLPIRGGTRASQGASGWEDELGEKSGTRGRIPARWRGRSEAYCRATMMANEWEQPLM